MCIGLWYVYVLYKHAMLLCMYLHIGGYSPLLLLTSMLFVCNWIGLYTCTSSYDEKYILCKFYGCT